MWSRMLLPGSAWEALRQALVPQCLQLSAREAPKHWVRPSFSLFAPCLLVGLGHPVTLLVTETLTCHSLSLWASPC